MDRWKLVEVYNQPSVTEQASSIMKEHFRSSGQHTCKFIGAKASVYLRKEFNSHRIGFGHQHGYRFIVLEDQYDCRPGGGLRIWKGADAHRKFSIEPIKETKHAVAQDLLAPKRDNI